MMEDLFKDKWDVEIHERYRKITGKKATWSSKETPGLTKAYLNWFQDKFGAKRWHWG